MAAAESLSSLRVSPYFKLESQAPVIATEWPELDVALPDRGFPQGVVELAAPHALGGGTSLALALVRSVQRKDARAYCAWVDPLAELYAPAVVRAGVELDRLIVVRPPVLEAGRLAAKVVESGAFEVVVIDGLSAESCGDARRRSKVIKPDVLVRKLALSAEKRGATVLLLTDSLAPRPTTWPVALRLEIGRAPGHVSVQVTKDRRGRVSPVRAIVPIRTRPGLHHATS